MILSTTSCDENETTTHSLHHGNHINTFLLHVSVLTGEGATARRTWDRGGPLSAVKSDPGKRLR